MILVDSSVWIHYFNGVVNPETDYLDEILDREIILVGDLILTEVLQGFRLDRQYQAARSCMDALTKVDLGGLEVCLQAADNYRTLRKKGITVRKTIDCVIATACIRRRIPLLFNDRDFEPFLTLGLKAAL